MGAGMVARRIVIGVFIGLLSVLGVSIPTLAQAGSTGQITVTSPAAGTGYAAYPLGSYNFPDRSGAFSPGLFEGSADPVTVRWQATGVSGDVTVTIILDGETVHTGAVAASTGAYTWQPAVGYGHSYSHYANCQAVVASLLDPVVAGTSSTFAIVPWGTVVQEWNGLAVYSNFPRPGWLAPGVDAIPWFGDSGAGFRYQCVELVQRWTTQTQHWQDKHGNALPEYWAGLYAKDMLTVARGYGLPTVSNDQTATLPPDPGDLLVWGSGSYGHAAVVGAVERDHLRVYEQNGANLQGTRTLALKRGSGTVWIDQEGVIGWIKPLQRYSFSDVGSSPYGRAIESLARAGIISGYPDGTFRPDAPVTRQQFAKMVVKSLGLPVSPSDDCPFVDVGSHMDPTDPLYPDRYVAVCAAHGITEGKTPTVFGPYDNMTRAQLITMVARAADLPEPPADFAPVFGNFSSDHYPWARKAAYAGLLDGLQGTGPSYGFWAPASRGEVAQILYDMMPLLPEVAELQSSIQGLDDALRTSMLASGCCSVAVPGHQGLPALQQ